MKSIVVFSALFVAVLSYVDPPKPPLAQSFESKFEIYVPELSPPHMGGKIWVDYNVGGGKATLSGEQFFPVYMDSHLVATPIPGTGLITAYVYHDKNCWTMGNFSNDWLNLFPLHIPEGALFAGNRTFFKDVDAAGWVWMGAPMFFVPSATEIWVDYLDNAVVSFMAPFMNVDFMETKVEHIDPSIYAKPNMSCPMGPSWETMFQMTGALRPLVHIYDTFYNPVKMPEYPEEMKYKPSDVYPPRPNQPPIPTLPQQFVTSWAQYVIDSTNNVWPFASGDFAIDNKLGGAKLMYGAPDAPSFSPMYFEMNVLASPADANVTAYIYGREICWFLGITSKDWLQIFPLQIPTTATFLGNVTCRDTDMCSSWTWQESYEMYANANLEVWVSYTIPEIVRFYVNVSVVDYGGNVYYDFYNTKIGPVNPDVFVAPENLCIPFMSPEPERPSMYKPIVDGYARSLRKKMSIHH
jgi:hypothetical protein